MNKNVFYINKFSKKNSKAYLSSIPPLMRRKLGSTDRLALDSMLEVFEEGAEEIVFSSRFGEIDRLKTIISQYQEFDEVSPAQFSASVHNYAAGFFTLYKKLNIPYFALSSGENSISAGLVKSVISKNSRLLFVYADEVSVACSINKSGEGAKCIFNPEKKGQHENEYESFIGFLEGRSPKFETVFGTFKREVE